jgi:hypothetical protein
VLLRYFYLVFFISLIGIIKKIKIYKLEEPKEENKFLIAKFETCKVVKPMEVLGMFSVFCKNKLAEFELAEQLVCSH